MLTLYELVLNVIVNSHFVINKLPKHIQNDIKYFEINKICANTVSKFIKNSYIYSSDGFFYLRGIDAILFTIRRKVQIANYAIKFEKLAKKGILPHPSMHFRSLMLYYIKQEPDFFTWYKHPTTCYYRCSFLDRLGA